MTKKELKGLIKETLKEELSRMRLKEEIEGPGYVIKAWGSTEQKSSGNPSFDSAKNGVIYKTYPEVLKALQSSELEELGAYEITWIKTK